MYKPSDGRSIRRERLKMGKDKIKNSETDKPLSEMSDSELRNLSQALQNEVKARKEKARQILLQKEMDRSEFLCKNLHHIMSIADHTPGCEFEKNKVIDYTLSQACTTDEVKCVGCYIASLINYDHMPMLNIIVSVKEFEEYGMH